MWERKKKLLGFWTPWKVSEHPGQFSDNWKISGHSGKFIDTLESFQTLWKVSGLIGKFHDTLEIFPDAVYSLWTLWNVNRNFSSF